MINNYNCIEGELRNTVIAENLNRVWGKRLIKVLNSSRLWTRKFTISFRLVNDNFKE